jgi:hypothetical protein
VAPVTARTLLMTGVPRGGTTLACQLLGRCRDAVALFEPMDVATLPGDRPAALDAIAAFCGDARASLLADGTAPSKQREGAVPDNPFGDERGANGRRAVQVALGRIRVEPPPTPGFTLVVKHNAAFAALLPELAGRFETLAIVRHPLSVLASWNSVDLPVRDGRVPAGERLDSALAAALQAQPDRLARQLVVLDWFFGRFAAHLPADRVLRYEDIVASQGAVLRARAGLAGVQDTPLAERNANALYAGIDIDGLADRLAVTPGTWTRWYGAGDIAALAHRMRAATP